VGQGMRGVEFALEMENGIVSAIGNLKLKGGMSFPPKMLIHRKLMVLRCVAKDALFVYNILGSWGSRWSILFLMT